jgi:t-SNARE complex subunit (syntaxin)
MIDPMTALAGIQSAVALIKKVSKTVDDVASLGPVLGKYFDAKSTATKAIVEAKNSGKKSSMAAAIEIEMAIHQAEEFEKQLQLLFMQSGKIDVWNKIKARSMAMDNEAAHAARKEKELRIRRKKEMQEIIEILIAFAIITVFLVLVGWGIVQILDFCQGGKC